MNNKFLYSGYLLTNKSKKVLLDWLETNNKQIKTNLILHHCTIQFGQDTIVSDDLLNQFVDIEVYGYVEDEKANAFLVRKNLSTNKNPHITISVDENTKPVYSNTLCDNKSKYELFTPLKIETKIIKIYSK
jgi:hypothetical protein